MAADSGAYRGATAAGHTAHRQAAAARHLRIKVVFRLQVVPLGDAVLQVHVVHGDVFLRHTEGDVVKQKHRDSGEGALYTTNALEVGIL